MIEPVLKKAPVQRGSTRGQAIGTIHDDATALFVYESVLEQVLDYSEQDLQRELGGFLVGGLFADRGHRYVEVRHFLPAVDARSQAASLQFTHETWSQFSREAEQRYPGELLVGWHHTHPNFGVFLSEKDLFIHRNFFREDWHVALVVDPLKQEFGFFQWRGGEIVDCGFICVFGPSPVPPDRR